LEKKMGKRKLYLLRDRAFGKLPDEFTGEELNGHLGGKGTGEEYKTGPHILGGRASR